MPNPNLVPWAASVLSQAFLVSACAATIAGAEPALQQLKRQAKEAGAQPRAAPPARGQAASTGAGQAAADHCIQAFDAWESRLAEKIRDEFASGIRPDGARGAEDALAPYRRIKEAAVAACAELRSKDFPETTDPNLTPGQRCGKNFSAWEDKNDHDLIRLYGVDDPRLVERAASYKRTARLGKRFCSFLDLEI